MSLGRERLGLVVSVGHVTVRTGRLEFADLRAMSPAGSGVKLSVGRVAVSGSLWALLLRGAAGVDRVDVSEASADLDVATPAFRALAERFRAGAVRSAGAGGPQNARIVHVAGGKLVLRDGARTLLDLQDARVEVGPRHVSLAAARARAGDVGAGPISAELAGLSVEADRDNGLRVRRFSIAQAKLELTSVVAHAATGRETEPDDTASAAAAPVLGGQEAQGSTRARAAPQIAQGSARATESSDEAARAKPAAAVVAVARTHRIQNLMARFAPGAELVLESADVQTRNGASASPILHGVHVEIRIKDEKELHLQVTGAAVGGGHVEANLRLWPTELRADGNVSLSSLPLTLLAPFLPSVPWYEPEHSSLDAELSIRTHSEGQLALSGHAALHDAALFSPRLAADAVRDISVRLDGSATFWPQQRRLEIAQGRLGLGKANVALHGSVELAADHYAYDLVAELPRTPCTDAVRAIPVDLLGDLSLAEWTGWLAGHVLLKTDSRELDKTVLNLDVTDRCEFVSVPAMADLRRFQEPFTQSVEEPDGTIFEMETGPGTEAWTPIDAISAYLIYAVLAHEDPQFFSHHGFSPAHIRDALVRNLREGRYVLGASTITMQLVKNVFLRREKTLARKIQEVLLTWWIERVLPKRDGLELYLNVIEYGPSLYGIRNAARHYFNRLPSELSPAESVFLATILPAPKRFHSFFERGALSPGWASQMRKMMQHMRERGFYTKQATEYGLQEIDHFKFTPEGGHAEPRVIPGGTAPLPYVSGAPAAAAAAGERDDAPDVQEPPADGYD
ncbi:MAG TPA: biosynthetic peptidoglycan transglycosylase [Polyangiales bacterium]